MAGDALEAEVDEIVKNVKTRGLLGKGETWGRGVKGD